MNTTPLPQRFYYLLSNDPFLHSPHTAKNKNNFKGVLRNANIPAAVVVLGLLQHNRGLSQRASYRIAPEHLHFSDVNAMSQQLDRQRLEHAFQGRPDLIGAIQHAASMIDSQFPL